MLDRIKLRLGIPKDDHLQDELINELILTTEQQLKAKLKKESIPEELNFIVVEVTVKKYNKVGSEGSDSEKVDVVSNNYEKDIFSEYSDILSSYISPKINYYTFGL